MIYLKSWLQEYIKEKLPENEVIADALNKKAFEVEEIKEIENNILDKEHKDFLFDIKVLPNRASDCLCHREMAREISACLDLDFVDNDLHTKEKLQNILNKYNKDINSSDGTDKNISINILCNDTLAPKEDERFLCTRFAGVVVDGIEVKESPEWLKNKLNLLGEKSINNIVDITNYVQFCINKPMHAYDFDNLEGDINVRFANESEILETLDNRNLELNNKTLVISDNKKALGLAGVKGGKYSGVNENTKTIFIESANFNNTLIRKTSQKYNLKTDASKRFENKLSDNLVLEGIYMTLNVLLKVAEEQGFVDKIKVYNIKDAFPNKENFEAKVNNTNIEVKLLEINSILGLRQEDNNLLTEIKVENILNKLSIKILNKEEYKDESGFNNLNKDIKFIVRGPLNRLDINIKEDIVEEIGRINGFINIKPVLLDLSSIRKPKINNYLLIENYIKDVFIRHGFSLVYNYAFRSEGEIKVLKPLSDDKKALRTNLTEGIIECVQKNISNMPLIDSQNIKVFEFGNVFLKDKEERRLAFTIDDGKKKSDFNQELENILSEIIQSLKNILNINVVDFDAKYLLDNSKIVSTTLGQNKKIIEINLEKIIEDNKNIFDNLPLEKRVYYPDYKSEVFKYQSFSLMPFIIRDVAFWSMEKLSSDKINNEILSEIEKRAGENKIKVKFFDEFEKDFDGVKKYSYAYRIIYQNKEKTLTDDEVNIEVENVYKYLTEKGFEIR